MRSRSLDERACDLLGRMDALASAVLQLDIDLRDLVADLTEGSAAHNELYPSRPHSAAGIQGETDDQI